MAYVVLSLGVVGGRRPHPASAAAATAPGGITGLGAGVPAGGVHPISAGPFGGLPLLDRVEPAPPLGE